MAIKPILFNTEMVQAILDGRKTCARRIVRPPYFVDGDENDKRSLITLRTATKNSSLYRQIGQMPYPDAPYRMCDILYVRETVWQKIGYYLDIDGETKPSWYNEFKYVASDEKPETGWNYSWAKRPSINMPKEAARIWLKVTDVRVERLQEIDEDGVWDEGFKFKPPCLTRVSADGHTCELDGPCMSSIKYCDMTMGELFGRELWNNTIKKSDLERYGWDANPYVFVIEFERCEKPEGV